MATSSRGKMSGYECEWLVIVVVCAHNFNKIGFANDISVLVFIAFIYSIRIKVDRVIVFLPVFPTVVVTEFQLFKELS